MKNQSVPKNCHVSNLSKQLLQKVYFILFWNIIDQFFHRIKNIFVTFKELFTHSLSIYIHILSFFLTLSCSKDEILWKIFSSDFSLSKVFSKNKIFNFWKFNSFWLNMFWIMWRMIIHNKYFIFKSLKSILLF